MQWRTGCDVCPLQQPLTVVEHGCCGFGSSWTDYSSPALHSRGSPVFLRLLRPHVLLESPPLCGRQSLAQVDELVGRVLLGIACLQGLWFTASSPLRAGLGGALLRLGLSSAAVDFAPLGGRRRCCTRLPPRNSEALDQQPGATYARWRQ